MVSVLEQKPEEGLKDFLSLCLKIRGVDLQAIAENAKRLLAFYQAKASDQSHMTKSQDLQQRWYRSLADGEPDYGVYNSLEYLPDLWACWRVYTRPGFRRARVPGSLLPHGVVRDIGLVKAIVDLGCGIGYTTAALTEIWSGARVFGTNFLETPQGTVAHQMALRHGFSLLPTIETIPGPVDLIVATEYFEHIQEPLAHLRYILEGLSPRCLLIANAFGTPSIGHFTSYLVQGEWVDQKEVSKLFNQELDQMGYEKVDTKIWNQRPSYWRKR